MGRGWGHFRGSKRLQVGPNQSSVPNSVFLPYYELNSNARRALGVAEFEEYWLEAGEE